MTIVRFAPSPTGYLHVGGARTALFNWLYARNTGGKFILRIEDTDVKRSTQAATQAILDGLKWLGLDWDDGPYFQSERLPIYREYARKLLDEDKAYYCTCSVDELDEQKKQAISIGRAAGYDGRCRDKGEKQGVLRLKTPEGSTVFYDLFRDRFEFDNSLIGDFVLIRSDGMPTYNFTCAVDDALMGMTHVIRGDDHIPNTPKQLLILSALGFNPPGFGHLPLILGTDKSPLSKRHGAVSVMAYQEQGFLPEAMVNYLALLGWSTTMSQQLFSKEEMIKKFSLKRIVKNPAVFDMEKLQWMNGVYIKQADPKELASLCREFIPDHLQNGDIPLEEIIRLYQERIRVLPEIYSLGDFFFSSKVHIPEEICQEVLSKDGTGQIKKKKKKVLGALEIFDVGTIEEALRAMAERLGIKAGDIIHPLRAVLTGKKASPGIFEVAALLGQERVVQRIEDMLVSSNR
ncbi:glutamate--tRNA ligase [Candidatus Desantisbacteria bacterium]|nr:glutamate--tRNA ligase [Candidatus Desantisbacteria bacterium]